jgi:hypothetical protein
VRIPKIVAPRSVGHYPYASLLDGDYKALARIIANRLRPSVTAQSSCTPGRTILEAVVTIRDAIAHGELTKRPGFIVSFDLASAFDSMSQEYLYIVHDQYGVGNSKVNNMKTLCESAQSVVEINGFLSHSFPVERSVRQGIFFYTLAMNPFQMIVERKLTDIIIQQQMACALAYADDVST